MCEQQFGGVVIVGVDKVNQNENSFCKMPDGSIIDSGTVMFYGLKNDKNQENGIDREPDGVKPVKKQKK